MMHRWVLSGLFFLEFACAGGAESPNTNETLGGGGTVGTTEAGGGSTDASVTGTSTDGGTTMAGGTLDGTADSSDGSSGSDDCAGGCDDEIPCTDDACVEGACVFTPVDAMCDDGIDCTTELCSPEMGCVNEPQDARCDDGVACTVDACDAARGCVATADDTQCDDGVGCTTDSCNPAIGCEQAPSDAMCDDGLSCTTDTCDVLLDCQFDATVLVYNGSNGLSAAPENVVAALGYTAIVVTNEAGFTAAYDAGGFGSIIVDITTGIEFSSIPVAMQTRLDDWIVGGGRLIFNFWNLDADAPMRTTLAVNTPASLNPTLPIYPDPASPVDLFNAPESIVAPITYDDYWADNGDQLSLAGAGFIAARFSDPTTGTGAITVTHAEHVITNGFSISEIEQGGTDADADGVNDGEELLRNELDYVCGVP